MPDDEIPASPADELPSLDADDPALALLEEGETEESAVEETEETPEAEETEGDESGHTVDKDLQQRQQKLANREKAFVASQERLDAALERLDELTKKLATNPSPAAEQAVETATRQSVMATAKAKIAEIEASPEFDPYKDGAKIRAIMFEAMEKLETDQGALAQETAASKKQRETETKHNAWWDAWAAKNPTLGRTGGEKLWSKAVAQAKAEAKASAADGVPITEGQATLIVFRRLVVEAKKATPTAKEKGPEGSGGRLGPTTGRAGGTVRQRDPLDEIYSDEDFRNGKFGHLTE